MRFFIIILNFLLIITALQAQTPASTIPGRISGIVSDAATQKPLPFASVAILKNTGSRDSLVGGGQTSEQGDFLISNLPYGSLKMRVSFVGYQTIEKVVQLSKEAMQLGTIALQPDASMLKEVKVTAEKGVVSMDMEKRVFNVSKSLTSNGGTAENLLKNVPSITMDETGTPSLRNMPTTIYVNGKPTQLTLAQIPANQIESVEVISNPSARFDASTSGGIVNLVLKRNRIPGYTGLVSLGVGNNARFDGMLNLDYNVGKWNLSALYNVNSTKNPLDGYAFRTNFGPDGRPESYFNQRTNTSLNNVFQNGRVSAEYALNAHNQFSLAATVVSGAFNTDGNQNYEYRNDQQVITTTGQRTTVPHNAFTNSGLEFDWKHRFAQKGRELSLTTSYTRNRVSNAADWLTTSLNADHSPQPGYPERDQITGRTIGAQYLAQLDYTHPLGDSAKLEMGLRSFTYARDQQYFFNQLTNGEYVLLRNFSQNADITETVNAAYVLYSKKLRRNISFQAGLRLEQSSLRGISKLDTTTFGYHYPSSSGQNWFQSFFPSLAVSKKLSENSEIGLNLSRKVGRPSFRHLFVGIQANDRQNITIGNPKVRPEFVNTAELNYNRSWSRSWLGAIDWLATAYYIYEDHTIKPLVQPSLTDSSVLITTFVNVKADIQYGMDHTVKFSLGRNLSVMANANVYNVILQSTTNQYQLWTYNTKLNLTYRFPANISAQLSGTNESRRVQLQGYRRGIQAADFALRKSFWQNRASATFTINDIFNSRRFVTIYDQPTTYQASMNRREIRFYKLSLQLPLGNSSLKRKDRKMERPDIDFSN